MSNIVYMPEGHDLKSFLCSLEQPVANLDQGSLAGEQSATSKSNPTASNSSWQESGTGFLTMLLFSQVSSFLSKKDMRKPTQATLTLSAQVSHASPSPLQEENKVKPTSETSGLKPSSVFARYDPVTASWKMFEASFRRATSKKSSKTWPEAGMMLAGELFRRPEWEHPISVNDSGSLVPTPGVPNGGRQNDISKLMAKGNTLYREDGSKVQINLETFVKLWPIPSVADATGGPGDSGRQGGLNLRTAVQRFATPQQRDHRTGSTARWEEARKGIRSSNLNDQIGGQLNPDWVEWLMDFPVGWTKLEPLDPEAYTLWLQQSKEGSWWLEEPDIPRTARKIPKRVSRLKGLGNAQVPLCVKVAWQILSEGLEDE